jgi:hypothetical protein
MTERDRERAARLRANRIAWRGDSRLKTRAARSMDESLRRMDERASTLDRRLRRHADESATWHEKWDEPLPK